MAVGGRMPEIKVILRLSDGLCLTKIYLAI